MPSAVTVISRILALVLCAACLHGCGDAATGQSRNSKDAKDVVAVESTAVQRITVRRRVDLSGTLVSPEQAKVSSEVAGVVREVLVQLGTDVRAGDILVRVDSQELKLTAERAESTLRQAEAQLGIDERYRDKPPPADEQIAAIQQAVANRDEATKAFTRAQQLRSKGLLSQGDFDTVDTRLKVMEANYRSALDTVHSLKAALQDRRAAYVFAQKKLADTQLRAPVAGSIAERLVQPGEYIREGTPVVSIVQMHPLQLKTAVQEKLAASIRPGQAVEFLVEAFPNRPFEGHIAYISPTVDQLTRTFNIEVSVENRDRVLKPGFFAKGALTIGEDNNVLGVPDRVVSTSAGVSTVFVIDGGKVRQQTVTLGVRQGDVWEVVNGLKGHETLAASNLTQLATGMPVRITGGGPGTRSPGAGGTVKPGIEGATE